MKKNYHSIWLCLILLFMSLMGIGYAQVSNITLEISGVAAIEKQEGIVIINAEYDSSTNANTEESKINQSNNAFHKNSIIFIIRHYLNIRTNY